MRTLTGIILTGLVLLSWSGCQSITLTREEARVPEGVVIFTFDDGPNAHENTTARLLDVLQKHEIRAMFALLGENAEHNPELVKRIAAGGHYIINHGYCDSLVVFMDEEEFSVNLDRGEKAIVTALGADLSPRLYRPQGGFYREQHRKLWESRGYTMVPATARAWDAVKKKTGDTTGAAVVAAIVETIDTQKGGIILLHDARDSYREMEAKLAKYPQGFFNRSWIPGAVEEIIIILKEKGYKFPQHLNVK